MRHLQPMLSLANARDEDELLAWEKRVRNLLVRQGVAEAKIEYVTEPKVDGLAVALVYEDGVLARGATRGNGEIGEDVTQNLKTIGAVPLGFSREGEGRCRRRSWRCAGEVYLPLADFARLNEKQRRRGTTDVCESAQLGGRLDPPARSRDHTLLGRFRSGATASAPPRVSTTALTSSRSSGCASTASR